MTALRHIILLLLCLATAQAAPVTVQWLPVVADPPVTQYRIYRSVPVPLTLIASTGNTSIVIDAQLGWQVVVTAFNGAESQPSAPLNITFPSAIPAAGTKRITYQYSKDLANWEDFQVIDLPATYQFTRTKIETP